MLVNDRFGTSLRFIRKNLNLTLKDVSDKTNISDATLQRYEAGKIKNIPFDKIDRIIQALEETSLLDWKEKQFYLAFRAMINLYNSLKENNDLNEINEYNKFDKLSDENIDFCVFRDSYSRLDRIQQVEFILFAEKELIIKNTYCSTFFLHGLIIKADAVNLHHKLFIKYHITLDFLNKYKCLDVRGRKNVNDTLEREFSYIEENDLKSFIPFFDEP